MERVKISYLRFSLSIVHRRSWNSALICLGRKEMGWEGVCLVVFCGQFKFLVLFQQPVPGLVLLQVLVVFPVFSQPQTSLALVTCVPSKWSHICLHIPDHSWEAVPHSFPHSYRFGISLSEQPQLPPTDRTSTFPLRDECEEQLGTAPDQTLWKYPAAGWYQRPQFVLSATVNHSNSHCEGCGQQGSSAAWSAHFWLSLDTGVSGLKPSQILWTDYYRRKMLFLCHCFIRGCICN